MRHNNVWSQTRDAPRYVTVHSKKKKTSVFLFFPQTRSGPCNSTEQAAIYSWGLFVQHDTTMTKTAGPIWQVMKSAPQIKGTICGDFMFLCSSSNRKPGFSWGTLCLGLQTCLCSSMLLMRLGTTFIILLLLDHTADKFQSLFWSAVSAAWLHVFCE